MFLDTSVIIAALLSSNGASYYILSRYPSALVFQINEYVFEEINRSLKQKFKNQPVLLSNLISIIGLADISTLQNPSKVEVKRAEGLISKKDATILASAFRDSDYLLTLDNEFFKTAITNAAEEKGLQILKPGGLIRVLEL